MQWPALFHRFISLLNVNINLEFLPFVCLTSAPLSFFNWLLLTLALPLIGSALLLALAAAVLFLSPRSVSVSDQIRDTPLATRAETAFDVRAIDFSKV